MSGDIDLGQQPDTYFRPQKLERYLLSKLKGAVLRKNLQALFDAGRHAEVHTLLTVEGISAADRKVLESFHPMFMGGNYLPDTEDGEVEIGRIRIKSTTYDVTCVYARPDEGVIHYRVVDEYDGDTLHGASEARTDQPMTLGEFADFFLAAWSLIDVLEMNFDNDQEASLDFFSAESEFYPDFDRLCRQRVIEHFPEPESDDDAEVHELDPVEPSEMGEQEEMDQGKYRLAKMRAQNASFLKKPSPALPASAEPPVQTPGSSEVDPMQPAIDAGEAFLAARLVNRKKERGVTDPSSSAQ